MSSRSAGRALVYAAAFALCAPIAAVAGAPAQPAAGQLPAAAQPAAQPPAPPEPPGAFEVVTRHAALSDSAVQAERAIARIADFSALASDVQAATRRQAELQALLAMLTEADHLRADRISRVRDHAVLEDQRLQALLERAFDRLERLGSLRADWLERQRFWRSWRERLRDDPDFAIVAPTLGLASGRIDSVLARIAAVTPELLAVQQSIEQLRAQTAAVASTVEALRAGRRDALLQRTQPVLFSPSHLAELAGEKWRAWSPLTALRATAHVTFLRDNLGILIAQLLLALALALLARRLRRVARPERGWSGLLDHPWALGVFISTTIAMQRIAIAPPLLDVAIWAVFAGAAALLAGRLFATSALRTTTYVLAGVFPSLLLLEAIRLPAPLFRIVLTALAAAGVVAFAVLARRSLAEDAADYAAELKAGAARPDATRHGWPFYTGVMVSAVVFVAAVLGYDALARWVLFGTLTSAAVVFVVVFLLVLARGAIATLLRIEGQGRARFLRTIGVPLAERIIVILRVALVIIGTLVLLDVWELAPSPIATWNRLIGVGFTVAGLHITLGRILLGVLIVYIAVLISWLIRTFVRSEVYRRWELDRGVGESINVLVHYALITAGVLIALASLGVELQNFAIVLGALGIGIGFGLQNVVSNFASGLILLFERPVRVGDTVVVDGEWGTIQKIGLRSTIMLTFDLAEMIVPNADLVSEKVTNWTLSNPIARVIMPVGVAYGSDIADVLRILRAAGTAHDAVLPDPPPQALFVGFGDSSLDFELRVWVREIRLRLEVRSVVLTEVERRFADAGIEIPFPQRDLHLRSIAGVAADAMLQRPAQ